MKFDKKFYWWEKVDVVNDNKMIQNFCLILSLTIYLFQKICLMSCNFTHKGYKKFNLYSSLLKIKICICMKKMLSTFRKRSRLNKDSSQAKYFYDWNQIRKFPCNAVLLKCNKSNISSKFRWNGGRMF